MRKLERLIEAPRRFEISGVIDGEADQNKVINALAGVIEALEERINMAWTRFEARGEVLSHLTSRVRALEERQDTKTDPPLLICGGAAHKVSTLHRFIGGVEISTRLDKLLGVRDYSWTMTTGGVRKLVLDIHPSKTLVVAVVELDDDGRADE